MISRSIAVISNKTRRANILLKDDFRNSIRLERVLERKSLAVKAKLLEDRDRTLKALALRSRQQEKDNRGVGGVLSLLGGGLLGRGLRRGGRIPKVPKLPTRGGAFLSRVGKVGKIGKIGPLAILGTGLDFAGRRAEGQTNLQAGIGAGSGLAGALAGAKYGAVLGTAVGGPVGTLIGGVGGSIIGGLAGGRIADLFTGAEKRRKFEEKRVELATKKSEFSLALDELDPILDKLEEISFLNLKKKEDEYGLPEKRFPFGSFFPIPKPKTPFYQKPAFQISALALLLAGAFALGGPTGEELPIGTGLLAAMQKTRLGAFIIKKSPFLTKLAKKSLPIADDVIQTPLSKKGLQTRADKILKDLGVIIKKEAKKFKITKGRTKIRGRKILRNQDKVTYSDKDDLSKIVIKPKPGELQKSLKLLKDINKRMNKNINSRKKKKFIQKNLFKDLKSDTSGGGTPTASLENEENNNIALAPTNNIFIIQQGDVITQSPTQSSGGNSVVVIGGDSDPVDAMYKYAEMTALQTA